MTYELSLEYGSFPVKVKDGLIGERQSAPEFLAGNQALLTKLETMNELFHDLFLTIECTFHYVGSQYPEKIDELRNLYEEVAQELSATYPEQGIVIEYFLL